MNSTMTMTITITITIAITLLIISFQIHLHLGSATHTVVRIWIVRSKYHTVVLKCSNGETRHSREIRRRYCMWDNMWDELYTQEIYYVVGL